MFTFAALYHSVYYSSCSHYESVWGWIRRSPTAPAPVPASPVDTTVPPGGDANPVPDVEPVPLAPAGAVQHI